jgi:hypothetical protein
MLAFLLQLAAITLAAVALLWGCGLLVAPLLLPRRYRALLPLVAPLLGFALLSALCHLVGAAGFGLRPFRWLFVGLAAAGWAVPLLVPRLRRFPRTALPALALCLLAFLLALWPLVATGYLTTVGSSIDAASYAARSAYLEDHALGEPAPEPGRHWLSWVADQAFLRAGDIYLVALLGLVTGRESHELLTLVPALFFALTAAGVYVWARLSLGLRQWPALLAAALSGTSNLLLCVLHENYLSQMLATAFVPLLLCFGNEGRHTRGWRLAALFGVLASTTISVYPVFAAYAVAGVLFSWCIGWLLRPGGRRAPAAARAVGWWLVAGAAAMAWNGIAVFRAASQLLHIGSLVGAGGVERVGVGGIVVYPPAIEALGLIAHASAAYFGNPWPRVPLPLLTALGVGFCGLAAFGWWRLGPRARVAAGGAFVTAAVLAAAQRWGLNPPHGYAYGWYKAISLLSPQLLALAAAGVAASWVHRSRRWVAVAATVVLLGVNAKHALWTASLMKSRVRLDAELLEAAQAAARLPADSWLTIDVTPGLDQNWLGVLLRDQRIRYAERLWISHVEPPRTVDAFATHALLETAFPGRRKGESLDEPWRDDGTSERLWSNGRYELRGRRDATLASSTWRGPWPLAAPLDVGIDQVVGTMTARLGPRTREAGLGRGEPRTLQARVFTLADTSRFETAGAMTADLGAGGWLLDVDLRCAPEGERALRLVAGQAVLVDLRVLGSTTGDPAACFEATALPDGLAGYGQEVLADGRVGLSAFVVRPRASDLGAYRLGVHFVDVQRHRAAGGRSLDFPPGAPVRRGSLTLDLAGHATLAEVDGVPVTPSGDGPDREPGAFRASVIWFQLPATMLENETVLWYRRGGDGKVTASAYRAPRYTILPPPKRPGDPR